MLATILKDVCLGIATNWLSSVAQHHFDGKVDRRRVEQLAGGVADHVSVWFKNATEHEHVSDDQSILLAQQMELLKNGLHDCLDPRTVADSAGSIPTLKNLCYSWAPLSRDLAVDLGMTALYDRMLTSLLLRTVEAMASDPMFQGLAAIRGLQDHDRLEEQINELTEEVRRTSQEATGASATYAPDHFILPSAFVPPYVVPDASERGDVDVIPIPLTMLLRGAPQSIELIGHAGTGKTEALKFLFNQTLNGISDKSVPVFLSFRGLEVSEAAVLSALSDSGIAATDWGNCIIMLDGLNESSADIRSRMIAAVYRTLDRCTSSRLVVSCRTRVFAEDGRIGLLTPYRILPFDMEQLLSFARNRLGPSSTEFVALVSGSACLSDLAKVPYYLEALAAKFERGIQIGHENRAALILDLIEDRVRSDCSKGVFGEDRSQAAEDRVNRLLNRVALGMQLLGRHTLSSADLAALSIPDADTQVIQLVEVVDLNSRDGSLAFTHDLIQETLAARSLTDVPLDIVKQCNLFLAGAESRESAIGNVFSLLGQLRTDADYRGWIFEHGPEFYVGTFSGEITPDEGKALLRSILEHYSGRGLPVNWHKYEATDLAELTEPGRAVPVLLSEIQKNNEGHPATNAMRILGYCTVPDELRTDARQALVDVAMGSSDTLASRFAVNCLTRLGLADAELAKQVFSRFGDMDDEDTRVMLYSLLHSTSTADLHLGFLISGIPLALGHIPGRTGSFYDEHIGLKRCLFSLQNEDSVIALLTHLSEKHDEVRDLFHGNDAEKLTSNLARVYGATPSSALWTAVFRWFLVLLDNYSRTEATALRVFFGLTTTVPEAFQQLLELTKKAAGAFDGLSMLLSDKTFPLFCEAVRNGILSPRDAAYVVNRTDETTRKNVLPQVEIELPEVHQAATRKRHQMIERSEQDDFDRWFDRDLVAADIAKVYDDLGSETISWSDFMKFQWERSEDISCSATVLEWLRRRTSNGKNEEDDSLSKTDALTLLEKDWEYIWIDQVFQLLRSQKGISVSDDQKEVISSWCRTAMSRERFRGDMWKEDDKCYYHSTAPLVAFFIAQLELELDAREFLQFASFDFSLCEFSAQGEILSYFKDRWPRDEYVEMAMQDFETQSRPQSVLNQHLEYFTAEHIENAVPYAQEMLRADDRDNLYHFEAFNYLKSMPNAQQLLEEVLPELTGQTFPTVLADLVDLRSEVACQVLLNRFTDDNVPESIRLGAARNLVRYGNLESLHYYCEYIKRTGAFSPHEANSVFRHLTSPEAIPPLMDLLKLAYSDTWKDDDEIDTLERSVLGGLKSISQASEENLDAVGAAIGEIIATDSRLAHLHMYFELWQDLFVRENSRPRSTEEVVTLLDQIPSCSL